MMTPEFVTLMQEMYRREDIITQLLSFQKFGSHLKKEFDLLEDLVAQIDEDEAELVDEWRTKLAIMWGRYAELVDGPRVRKASLESSDQEDEHFSKEPIYDSERSDYSNDRKVRFTSDSSDSSKPILQLKHPLIYKMEKMFRYLPAIKNMEDIDGVKKILTGVVKTFKFLPPQLDDRYLQAEAFHIAFAKLPSEGKELFSMQFEEECLYFLFDFLRLEVENYSENHRLHEPNLGLTINSLRKLESQCRDAKGKQIEPCHNCKASWHTIKNCPTLKMSYCLSCFRFGHVDKICLRALVFTR